MIKGVLFDMDGVLVDSEKYICQAAVAMFAEKGLLVKPEDFLPFVGTGENRYIGGVAEQYHFSINITEAKERTYAIYIGMIHGVLNPLPGVHSFIERCRRSGLRLAVATSADRVKMQANLAEIGLPVSTFDATVNGLEIERKKPFPDIYIKAADMLGLRPEECLVVEDAVSGIAAGINAGCRCLALCTSFGRDQLIAADWICNTLQDAPDAALNW